MTDRQTSSGDGDREAKDQDRDDGLADAPAADSSRYEAAKAALALKAKGDAGANWFFVVAGLSLVNTIIAHIGGDRHFIVGLALTAIVDAIAKEIGKQQPDIATMAAGIAIGFSCFVALVAVLFGWMSRKRWLAPYAIGMVIYGLDGVLYFLLGDLLSGGFHIFALFSMFGGFNAYRNLSQIEDEIRDMHDEVDEVDEPDGGLETQPA